VLDNRQELFRAGQYAQARVVLPDDAPRLTLPISAVGQASGQDFVWTLEKDALVRRIVITGRKDAVSDRIEIAKGLAADSQVLGARFDNLREGQPAKIVTQRTAPKAASAASAVASS
jgi:multidrug efflux pump subunit AcrA (membrane-fusion protein)